MDHYGDFQKSIAVFGCGKEESVKETRQGCHLPVKSPAFGAFLKDSKAVSACRKEFSDEPHYEGNHLENGETPMKSSPGKRFWKEWGDVIIMLAVVLVLFKVIFMLAWVPTGSMETTIPTRSLQIAWRLPYLLGDPQPERGDVLTFWSEEANEVMVKRVIGLPGETVSFQDGYVYIDGQQLAENYLPVRGMTQADSSFTVPEGCVFFMGDNRVGSYDARFWQNHYIPFEEIQAKVLLTISFGRDHSWTGIRLIT